MHSEPSELLKLTSELPERRRRNKLKLDQRETNSWLKRGWSNSLRRSADFMSRQGWSRLSSKRLLINKRLRERPWLSWSRSDRIS